ncbi:hypothetical protein AU377_02985 [Sporosarcina sp. HYO08]|nr:hypothetical protein AU377_02985 [Sporosarcina sp. HYO08]
MIQKNLFSNQLFILFGLVSIFIQTYNLPNEYRTITGSFYEQFYGLSTEGFNLYNYLFVTIIFLFSVTIFFNNVFIASKGDIYYQLIRYPSFKQWFYQILRRMVNHSFLTISILFIYTLFLALVFDFPFIGNYPFSSHELFYHFIVNGFLQLLNYHLIFVIFICLTKKIEFILLNIGILIVLGLPLFNSHWLFPIVLNSLGYITGGFYQPIRITLILGIYLTIELLIIKLLLSKKLIL